MTSDNPRPEPTSRDTGSTPSEGDAAAEAAQNVVDDVTSWEYSGDRSRIEDELDSGLEQAGVEVDQAERQRLVDEIEDLKKDETGGTPEVESARPADG